MRLSEAIRLGAMLKPQGFGDYWTRGGRATCAIGAACEASGISFADYLRSAPVATFEQRHDANGDRRECPACSVRRSQYSMTALVIHLNDDHHWTREQIADLVETIERQHEPAQAEAAVDPVAASQHELSTRDA